VHTKSNPHLAVLLNRQLTQCTSGLFAGHVSRRIHDTLSTSLAEETATRGGIAILIRTDPTAAQGFSVTTFGASPTVTVCDGLALSILSKISGK
jgi:hypothetical protein